jgi:hypothetical protein
MPTGTSLLPEEEALLVALHREQRVAAGLRDRDAGVDLPRAGIDVRDDILRPVEHPVPGLLERHGRARVAACQEGSGDQHDDRGAADEHRRPPAPSLLLS